MIVGVVHYVADGHRSFALLISRFLFDDHATVPFRIRLVLTYLHGLKAYVDPYYHPRIHTSSLVVFSACFLLLPWVDTFLICMLCCVLQYTLPGGDARDASD